MTMDLAEFFPDLPAKVLSTRCMVGGPVKITKDEGVVTIALDSQALNGLRKDFISELRSDEAILAKLDLLAKNYGRLFADHI